MHIIIDTYGIDLKIENNRLVMQKGDVVKQIVPSKIFAIHIFAPCALTSPVIAWAADYDIAVLVYNSKGKVAARLWQPHFGSHAAIRLQQIQFCKSLSGLLWVKSMLLQKAMAQVNTLNGLSSHLRNEKVIQKLNVYVTMLRSDTGINLPWLRGIEAVIGRWYWSGVVAALKQHIEILPRNLRPAKDRFNAILNYLYGTLYGIVEGSIIAAGLDAHLGIMHRMEYNTPSLVFDAIEPFRHWADDFLIQMILENRLSADFTEEVAGGILLTAKGKKTILTAWFIYLQEKTPAPKKLIKRKDQVQQMCTALAARLLDEYKQENKEAVL